VIYDKIIKRDDGSRVKIVINVIFIHNEIAYRTTVLICIKGKRTWRNATDSNDYTHRALSMEDRVKKDLKNQLTIISESEMLDAKLEAWQQLKP
jgi:hypothetical protein